MPFSYLDSSRFAFAFLHEAGLGRARERFAVLVDCLRLAGVFGALCHEALERGAGKWLTVLADRLCRARVLCHGGARGKDREQEHKWKSPHWWPPSMPLLSASGHDKSNIDGKVRV